MSLSPIALEALRAAQTAFTESEADVFEDALARGLEAVDREGRLVGAFAAAELERLRERVAELEKANAGLDDLRIRALDKNSGLQARVDEVERKYTFDTAELKRQLETARVDGQRLIRAEQRAAELEAVLGTHRRDDQAEIERLRKQVAELLAERHSTNEALDDAVQALRSGQAQREALAERLRAGQQWLRGRNPELVSENLVSQSELREIFGIPLTSPWEGEPTAKCRCDEPDTDPYSCEADDCSGHFSELNPFRGARPVDEPSAEVSRTCGCGWRTSVWHVDDGSAEEELHGHVTRVHGGTYPEKAGAR